MIEFNQILCPVDFSEPSIRALTDLAAQLTVLHVVPALADGVASEQSGRTSEPGTRVSRDDIASEIQLDSARPRCGRGHRSQCDGPCGRGSHAQGDWQLRARAVGRRDRHGHPWAQRIDHARERLHAYLAQESTTWCEIKEVVATDRAYKAVLQHTTTSNADLIVMAAQGTAGLELMVYGSNIQHALRTATCPVLTVHA